MKYWLPLLFAIILSACSNTAPPVLQTTEVEPSLSLPSIGTAPELTNEVWLNTDQPLRLADLGGQVVLLEMWTFG